MLKKLKMVYNDEFNYYLLLPQVGLLGGGNLCEKKKDDSKILKISDETHKVEYKM